MTFLIQFKRFRRGVPEVIGTLPIAAADGAAALAFARSLAGNETLAIPDRCSACDGRWWPHAARLDRAGSDCAAGHLLTHPCSGEARRQRPRPRSSHDGGAPRREPDQRPPWASIGLLWDRPSPTRRMVSPRSGKAAMRSSGSMIRITGRDTRSEAQISRMTGSSMSTNSARTWVPAVVGAEVASPVRLQTSQKPAPSCHGRTANPSRWRHEGKRVRHGTEHPQFGDIDHAQDLGCVDI